jgi:hypothetical protein
MSRTGGRFPSRKNGFTTGSVILIEGGALLS